MNLEADEKQGTTALTTSEFNQGLDETLLTLEDRWILSVLNRTITSVNTKLDKYLFDQATLEAYDFFWKEFCAYYVEITKPILFGKKGSPEERKNKQKLLVIILLHAIRLIHPMAPFITEELFQRLKTRLSGVQIDPTLQLDPYTREAIHALNSEACIVTPYPSIIRESDQNAHIDDTFALIESLVYTIRNIRGEMKIPPGTPIEVHIVAPTGHPQRQSLMDNQNIIEALVRLNSLKIHSEEPQNLGHASLGVIDGFKVMLPIPAEMLEQEKTRLLKEKERLTQTIEKVTAQLNNENFVKNAPSELIAKQRALLQQAEEDLQRIQKTL
ncbi:MAG: class I tRNA ligase family protein, partial [Parachlamydiaceae bacterium]